MKNLIAFIAKYNHWFVFVILEAISAVLLFQFNSYQGSVWFSTANVAAGKIYAWNSEIESFFSLTKVNEELTQRNIYLEHQVTQLSNRISKLTDDGSFLHSNQLQMLANYKLMLPALERRPEQPGLCGRHSSPREVPSGRQHRHQRL